MSTVPLQVFIDDDLFKRASAKANLENKPLDQILARLIADYVGDFQIPAPIPPPTPTPEPAPAYQTYVVQTGDSLSLIAKKFYGDANKYAVIAQYNNISDYRRIYPGQILKIPTLAPVPPPTPTPPAPPTPPPAPALKPGPFPDYPPIPDGLEQLKQVFGAFQFIEDPNTPGAVIITDNWQQQNIVLQNNVPVLPNKRILCHAKLAPIFVNVFAEIQDAGLANLVRTYEGCFYPRHKMLDPKRDLSVHSWGIALDLNASTNMPGTQGDMDPRIVKIFEKHGFYWGGNFGDPMHFQYCTSY